MDKEKEEFREYTNAIWLDDWLVKIGQMNNAGYLLSRWGKIKVIIKYTIFRWWFK